MVAVDVVDAGAVAVCEGCIRELGAPHVPQAKKIFKNVYNIPS